MAQTRFKASFKTATNTDLKFQLLDFSDKKSKTKEWKYKHKLLKTEVTFTKYPWAFGAALHWPSKSFHADSSASAGKESTYTTQGMVRILGGRKSAGEYIFTKVVGYPKDNSSLTAKIIMFTENNLILIILFQVNSY